MKIGKKSARAFYKPQSEMNAEREAMHKRLGTPDVVLDDDGPDEEVDATLIARKKKKLEAKRAAYAARKQASK